MDKNKWGNREHPKSWYSFAHAANLKMELEDYLHTSQKDIILRRDSLLDQYYNKLKNGDPQ